MIIRINPNLLDSHDAQIQKYLARIVDLYFDERFIWDRNNALDIFGDIKKFEQTTLYKTYLSLFLQSKIVDESKILLGRTPYQTVAHDFFLSSLTIGLEKGEVNPKAAFDILNLPSLIILENGINDWNFFVGIVEKYKAFGKNGKSSIYSLISKSINKKWLNSTNAGGNGGIINFLTHLGRNDYKGIIKFKLATFFDSDKEKAKDDVVKISENVLPIIRSLKNNNNINTYAQAYYEETDWIKWHVLYKRAIENYVPISIIKKHKALPDELLEQLEKLNIEDIDFYKYKNIHGYDVKNNFPKLFLDDWKNDKLEAICQHHKCDVELPNGNQERVSEIEELLVKISKII